MRWGLRALLILVPIPSAFARNGFDIDIIPETESIASSVSASQNPDEVAFIGPGRSPTSAIASLQNRGFSAINIPLSNFSEWFGEQALWEQRNSPEFSPSEGALYRVMDKLIPRSFFAKKKIVLVDLAHSGRSLANFAVELKKYAKLRSLPQPEIELQYLGEPVEKVTALLRGEGIPYRVHAISADMARIMGADGFRSVSEYGPLMIENGRALYWPHGDDTGGAVILREDLSPIAPRAEYGAFKESLKLRQPFIWGRARGSLPSAGTCGAYELVGR